MRSASQRIAPTKTVEAIKIRISRVNDRSVFLRERGEVRVCGEISRNTDTIHFGEKIRHVTLSVNQKPYPGCLKPGLDNFDAFHRFERLGEHPGRGR